MHGFEEEVEASGCIALVSLEPVGFVASVFNAGEVGHPGSWIETRRSRECELNPKRQLDTKKLQKLGF